MVGVWDCYLFKPPDRKLNLSYSILTLLKDMLGSTKVPKSQKV